jgi:hypothetical protein
MQEGVRPPVVEVGMGATELHYSDCDPYTVIRVITQKKIIVQEDNWKIVKGSAQDGSAQYEYTRNPGGAKAVLTLRADGCWREEGFTKKNGGGWAVGFRRKYFDPSF